jgi:dienelactone hydrolase
MVDGNKGPIPNLLPAEDVQKIATLQSAPFGSGWFIVSPVSPDDQAVLVANPKKEFLFLNIRDGALTPLKLDLPVTPLTNYVWLDNDNVALLAIVTRGEQTIIETAAFDRRDGQMKLGLARLAGFPPTPISLKKGEFPRELPVLVSPNQRKLLFASLTEKREGGMFTTRLPGAGAHTFNPVDTSRQAPFRVRFAQELAANPQVLALADFAQAFEPISFFANLLIGEGTTIRVADLASGQSREVLTLARNTLVMDVNFSESGDKFSITSMSLGDDPKRELFDGARLSEIIYRDVTGNLPPQHSPLFQTNSVTVLDFPSGSVSALRAADGAIYMSSSWSTDNQTLLVKAGLPGRAKGRSYLQLLPQYQSGFGLRFYDSQLREVRRVDRVEVTSQNMLARFISPDEVLIETQVGTNQHPYYYNLRSGDFRNIADRAGTFFAATPTNRSREIVFVYSSYTDPADLYRMRWDGTAFARLTWQSEEARKASQTKQYPVSFTLRNGETFDGVLILPADVPFPPRNVPIVLWQEGGPTLPVLNNYYALAESPQGLLPNFGFGVLVVPLYGRYGLGPDRFNALADRTNYGQIDIDAQAEIARQLRARGWASKLGIVGCSYGGYFVTQSIARHPTVYDAAHTMCSLVDMITEWSRGYPSLAPWAEGLPPQAALEEYRRDSPAYNAQRIRTPLLAFHGTNDFLPLTVMENMMLQVINNGVPAKMLKFQDADHGFLRSTPPELSKAYELYGAQEQILSGLLSEAMSLEDLKSLRDRLSILIDHLSRHDNT